MSAETDQPPRVNGTTNGTLTHKRPDTLDVSAAFSFNTPPETPEIASPMSPSPPPTDAGVKLLNGHGKKLVNGEATVQPHTNGIESPQYLNNGGWNDSRDEDSHESIVEREIRLAKEREGQMKRETREANKSANHVKVLQSNLENKYVNGNSKSDKGAESKHVNGHVNGNVQDQKNYYNNMAIVPDIKNTPTEKSQAPDLNLENVQKKNNSVVNSEKLIANNVRTLKVKPNMETVIEREVRLQREREESLAEERKMATMAAHMRQQLFQKENSVEKNGRSSSPSESAIAKEMREMRERQQFQQQPKVKMNNDTFTDNLTNGLEDASDCSKELPTDIVPTSHQVVNGNYASSLTSSDNNDHTACELLSAQHRTTSMDSLSSGGAPVLEFPSRRSVRVKPLVDEENEPPLYRVLNETAVEREVRLTQEREETLRRDKGLATARGGGGGRSADSCSPCSTPSLNSLDPNVNFNSNCETVADGVVKKAVATMQSRPLDLSNSKDRQNVQKKIATSRIQQEIEEQTQRELALRAAGTIRTTSVEHTDSKVTRITAAANSCRSDEADHATIQPPTAGTPSTPDSEPLDNQTHHSAAPTKVPLQRYSSLQNLQPSQSQQQTPPHVNSHRVYARSATTSIGNFATIAGPRRAVANPANRGVMQKFIASRGKVVPSFSAVRDKPSLGSGFSSSNLVDYNMDMLSPREQLLNEIRTTPPKRNHCSTETKIQEELKLMKAREEEHKRNRAKMLAISQPNLLSILDDDDIDNGGATVDDRPQLNILRERAISNPNLLDDASTDDDTQVQASMPQKVARRRSALIAQWEEMIQQKCDN